MNSFFKSCEVTETGIERRTTRSRSTTRPVSAVYTTGKEYTKENMRPSQSESNLKELERLHENSLEISKNEMKETCLARDELLVLLGAKKDHVLGL